VLLGGEKHKCRDIEDGYDLHSACATIAGATHAEVVVHILEAKGHWNQGILDKESAVTAEMAAECTKDTPLEVLIAPKGTTCTMLHTFRNTLALLLGATCYMLHTVRKSCTTY